MKTSLPPISHGPLFRFFAICSIIACLLPTARAQSVNGNGAANGLHGPVTGNSSTSITASAAVNYLLTTQPSLANKLPKPLPAPAKSEGQAIVDQFEATVPGLELDLNVTKAGPTSFSFSTTRSAPVVLYFWHSRDQASIAGLTYLRSSADKYPTVSFFGTNFDPSAATASKTPGGILPPGTQKLEPRGVLGDIPQSVHVAYIPEVFVFDATGKLIGLGPPQNLPALLAAAVGKKN